MNKLIYRIRSLLFRGVRSTAARLSTYDPSGHLIVFSDPRGGSTWLAQILLSVSRTALLWEPLNVAFVSHYDDLEFSLRQHIPREADWPEARHRLEAMLRGELMTHYTCRTPMRHLFAERLVVKICRGNALLPWFTQALDLRFDPVHLVRHPFAVVASQLQKGAWDRYEGFHVPEGVYTDYYRQHESYLNALETKYESLTAQWSLTNLIPLRSEYRNRDWITVSYEHLLERPGREIERIFRRWGMETPEGAMRAAKRVSSSTKQSTFESGRERQLSKWTRFFSEEQIERMMGVLDHFGVKEYGRDLRPSETFWSQADGGAVERPETTERGHEE